MEITTVSKTEIQTKEQIPPTIPSEQPRHRHRAIHRLDIRHFTEFELSSPRFNGTYDISKANGRLKRFDYARTNGTILHLWEQGFYAPKSETLTPWDGSNPDIADVLELNLAGGISLKRADFLRWIPTNRKMREDSILHVILGNGIVDLELTRKEDKQVLVPTEEPPFELTAEATYNPEFIYYSLCGMSEVFKLWIGSVKANSDLNPLVMASEMTVAMIANVKH